MSRFVRKPALLAAVHVDAMYFTHSIYTDAGDFSSGTAGRSAVDATGQTDATSPTPDRNTDLLAADGDAAAILPATAISTVSGPATADSTATASTTAMGPAIRFRRDALVRSFGNPRFSGTFAANTAANAAAAEATRYPKRFTESGSPSGPARMARR